MVPERRCVCLGSSRCLPDSEDGQLARACGEQLARMGWTVLSGGYEGAMGAVSRGARDEGGRVIGVTTPIFAERRWNEALHAVWTEPDYLSRMTTLLRQAHAVLALPGGLGTLSEWVTALCLTSIGEFRGPLILFREPWEAIFRSIIALDEVPDELESRVHWIGSPGELRGIAGLAGQA